MLPEPPGPRRFHGTVDDAIQLAHELFRAGDLPRADRLCRQITEREPDRAAAWHLWGLVAQGEEQSDVAVERFARAAALEPHDPVFQNALGESQRARGELESAIAAYRQALALAPHYAEAHSNLGISLRESGRIAEAVDCYNRALEINAELADAHWNRALAWLLVGDFKRGWPEYEWRWRRTGAKPRLLVQPQWDGSPLDGRTILVYAEQGLGDTLQFVRYLKLVRERGGRVLLECSPALVPLLTSLPHVERLIPRGEPLPAFEVQAALLSLPGLFDTRLDNVPCEVPYLTADAELVKRWRAELAREPGFKIGIVWQGSPRFWRDRLRSVPLASFAPLASVPGVRLYSLQKGSGETQLAGAGFPIVDLGDQIDRQSGRFMDTAAVMQSLDLVITSDTAPAHLAGALGVPVWLALSTLPDWRWLLDRYDSPWYPTMRLFRQHRTGDWEAVFRQMTKALEQMVLGV